MKAQAAENTTLSERQINDNKFDLADLVCVLLALKKPDRNVDILVDVLLGQKVLVSSIDISDVKSHFWLKSQVPEYTKGTVAVNALAHRRGYLLENFKDGADWVVETRDLVNDQKISVRHKLKGVAGVVGIATLSSRKLQ